MAPRSPAEPGPRPDGTRAPPEPTISAHEVLAAETVDGEAVDEFAVPQHGHLVGEFEHLVKAVADVDDPHAMLGEPPNEGEEGVGLRLPQGGRGLVEDQQPRVQEQGAADLDHLALGEADHRAP